ncbi:MAG: translocation/assembly module TamB domain-containing protein [Crocinitomicaceae bacterium]|nr:translocation/assembly module TamB domain-containing protein [Crocinitomicaceae bacterium]
MAKVSKIIGILAIGFFEWLTILLIVIVFAIRSYSVQTFLAQKATAWLTQELGTTVNIDRVEITFFDQVFFDGLFVGDQNSDTLAFIQEIKLNFNQLNILRNPLLMDDVRIKNAVFKIAKYEDADQLNFQFILDAFAPKEKKDPTDFALQIKNLELIDVYFSFDNYHYPVTDFGIDYNHIATSDLNLNLKDVVVGTDQYGATINTLRFRERSGLVLNDFQANLGFSNQGLSIEALTVDLGQSDLYADYVFLKTSELKDYSNFVDKVLLELDLKQGNIFMQDVAMFAPVLRGMDAQVQLSGKTIGTLSDWKMNEVEIYFGTQSYLCGDFHLPTSEDIKNYNFQQFIRKLNVTVEDLTQLKLPGEDEKYLEIPAQVRNLGWVNLENLNINSKFRKTLVDVGQISTGIGNITFLTPVLVDPTKENDVIHFGSSLGKRKYIQFDNFNLGRLLQSNQLGIVQGQIGLNSAFKSDEYFLMKDVYGLLNRFDAVDYPYKNILLEKVDVAVEFGNRKSKTDIDGVFYVRDENLDLTYKGYTSFGEKMIFDVVLDLECAKMEYLHPVFTNRGELFAQFSFKGEGSEFDDFFGETLVDSIFYKEGENSFFINHFEANLSRLSDGDELNIHSDILDAQIKGSVDFDLITDNVLYQASRIFPVFFTEMEASVDPNINFSYNFEVQNLNPIMAVFAPQLEIADQTRISGAYNGGNNTFDLNINSNQVRYGDFTFSNIRLFQELHRGELLAFYRIEGLNRKDSLVLRDIRFTNIAANSFMDSQLIVHDKKNARSNLEWQTLIFDTDGFDIDVLPSFFTINNHRWDLRELAHINFSGDCFLIENFRLEREEQYVDINGQVSRVPTDFLQIEVNNLDLEDVAALLLPDQRVSGRADISGILKDPYETIKFSGISEIENLVIDDTQVGNIGFIADFDPVENKISMNGDLLHRSKRTFLFDGAYWLNREGEELDFKLSFNQTDIEVLNSFMDEDVVRGISGNLIGYFDLRGSVNSPILDGRITLKDGAVELALLGASFQFNGDVISNDFGILINNMPVTDEEGNMGALRGQILHDRFTNFLYELNFDFQNHPFERNPLNRSEPLRLERFKVMKTRYTEDAVYYGDAYLTGNASVFGTADNMTINVNARTRRGTWINFPMYGPKTIAEEGFITFKTEDVEDILEEAGINFSGVNLSLNFDVTPDARVKLIFDDQIGDEISARGEGLMKIGLDNYGDISLNGTYRVTEGVYNFVMGPIRQNFFISPGGTVQWTGDPFSAQLNIETFYITTANLGLVMADVIENRATQNEEIFSYLRLVGDMTRPEISFDLGVPRGSEASRAVINRIRADQEELNRQFFSLLLTRSLSPLIGQESRAQQSSNNAALDLVSNQINALLSKVSQDYRMNINLESDDLTGESSVEFGVKKNFMDDRLIVSGSFGVAGQQTQASQQNNLIGDLYVEYLLNDKGTFRINAFNESNANSIVINTNRGHFTQGVGINYREEFYNLQDFNTYQFIADIFRSDKQLNYRDLSRYRPIPAKYLKREEEREVEESESESEDESESEEESEEESESESEDESGE